MHVFLSYIFDYDITLFTTHDVQIQFSSKVAEMILLKVVSHQSPSMFASKCQFGIAEWNENVLQKIKTVLTLCRICTMLYSRLHTFSWRLVRDEKIKYKAFCHVSVFH